MPRPLWTALALTLSPWALLAQGIYQNANSPTDPICPRLEKDKTSLNFGAPGPGTTGGMIGADSTSKLYYQQGRQYFPQGQRKSVATFAAYDEKAKGTSIAALKGKVVLVGLWSVRCDPSAKMLMEFASLYPKREQFGFEILAVNFDQNQQDGGGGIEGGWRAISKFKIKNRQFFDASHMPVYTPGLGKEGASNFMDIVHSLPAMFVIDREGNFAQLHIGYKDGFVGEALQMALRERLAPPPPAAPSPEAAKPAHP
ncbi:MAG: TlpA disulfide reductase family protein [Geothrix sp.]|nr:TlpA disulfide reductase family protein [Geothrix sp.]